MDKQGVVYPCIAIVPSNKVEQIAHTKHSMDDSKKYYADHKKSDAEEYCTILFI